MSLSDCLSASVCSANKKKFQHSWVDLSLACSIEFQECIQFYCAFPDLSASRTKGARDVLLFQVVNWFKHFTHWSSVEECWNCFVRDNVMCNSLTCTLLMAYLYVRRQFVTCHGCIIFCVTKCKIHCKHSFAHFQFYIQYVFQKWPVICPFFFIQSKWNQTLMTSRTLFAAIGPYKSVQCESQQLYKQFLAIFMYDLH